MCPFKDDIHCTQSERFITIGGFLGLLLQSLHIADDVTQ